MKKWTTFALFLFLMQTSSWGQIVADFIAPIQKGCAPLAVKFEDKSVGNPVKWEWDFGNGNKSTLRNPSAIYIQSGIYTVSLTVENANGQKNTKTMQSFVEVFKNPQAQFSVSLSQVCINSPLQFNNLSKAGSGIITHNIWDFGDGKLINTTQPTHYYSQAGFKHITLIVRDANGCESVVKKDSAVFVFPYYPFDFTLDKSYSCDLNTVVGFNFKGTSDIVSFQWDFGDGNTSSNPHTTHTYKAKGRYDVRLAVRDKNNCPDTLVKSSAYIAAQITPSFSLKSQPVCFDQEVVITNTSSYTLPHEPRWKWIFDDNSIQNSKDAIKSYQSEGVFPVKLIASDTIGKCFDTIASTVSIQFLPIPSIRPVFADSQLCQFPSQIRFRPSSTVQKAFWRFTNKTEDTSVSINPTFLYAKEGIYTLHYKFLAPNGCWVIDSLENQIDIHKSGFQIQGDNEGCVPKSVPFVGTLLGKFGIDTYRIFLNDTLLLPNTQHITYQNNREVGITLPFDSSITGKIQIEVTNLRGCRYTDSILYSYGEKTNPYFEFSDTQLCIKNGIFIKNLTETNGKDVKAVWKFTESGDTLPMWDGKYVYEEIGKHSISLITRINTCYDTLTLDTIIKIDGPKAGIGIKKEPCTGKTTLSNTSQDYTRYEWYINNEIKPQLKDSFVVNLMDAKEAIAVKIIAYNDSNDCPPDSLIEILLPVYSLKAAFEAITTGNCAPLQVQLRNQSSSKQMLTTDRYYWYVNNERIPVNHPDSMLPYYSNTSLNYGLGEPFSTNPRLTITANGTYRIKLIANREGCLDSTVFDYVLNYPMATHHSVSWNGSCVPVTVNLTDFNTAFTRSVRLGNGEIRNNVSANFSYTYTNAPVKGFYNYVVYFTDANGCVKWEQYQIPVSGPNVGLTFTSNTEGCNQPQYSFAALIQNNPNGGNNFKWNIGEDIELLGEKVQYTFDTTGSYPVLLSFTDDAGCVATSKANIWHVKQDLRAIISADTTTSPCPPLFVNFKNQSMSRSGVPIIAYNWDFGDGTYSSLPNPSKTYTKVGRFTVRLTVTDASGCVNTGIINDFIVVRGPTGTYNFTPKEGCVPHEVLLSVQSSSPNDTYYWDLGDGETSTSSVFYKTYHSPGVYTPFIFLTDSNGCRNALPANGTIKVNPNPIANFSASQFCFHKPTTLIDQTQHLGIPITQYEWKIEDTILSGFNPLYLFKKNGLHKVQLKVRSASNCVDSISKPLSIYGFQPKISSDTHQICLGQSAIFFNQSFSDTFLRDTKTKWMYNGNVVGSGPSFSFQAPQKGFVDLGLYLEDVLGCDTTITINKALLVGDTLSPPPLDMSHVSVIDDHNLQVKFKASLEPDFKYYHLYWQDSLSELHKINTSPLLEDTLLKAVDFPTLHKVHCFTAVQENICSLQSHPEDGEWHCSIELSGTVDSNRSILHWTPYIGWSEVEYYDIYKKSETDPTVFDSIARVPGNHHSYIDSVDCYTDLFSYRVKAIEKQGDLEKSWSDTCKVKPIYAPFVYAPYYLVGSVPDNQNISSEIVELKESRKPISYYKVERALEPPSYRQIGNVVKQHPTTLYIDSGKIEVQKHSYYYRVKAVDICDDESAVSNYGKTILLQSKLNESFKPVLYWTPYEYWEEAVDYYIIEKEVSAGVFEQIGRTVNGQDTQFTHSDLSNHCSQRYQYRVLGVRSASHSDSKYAYENVISISNITSVPVESRLFAPNAFSPNKDGLNEVLECKGIFIDQFVLQVYNRWGEKLYESTDCYPTWDATFKGEPVPSGVYVYKLKAIGADGKLHSIAQDVTLLR